MLGIKRGIKLVDKAEAEIAVELPAANVGLRLSADVIVELLKDATLDMLAAEIEAGADLVVVLEDGVTLEVESCSSMAPSKR